MAEIPVLTCPVCDRSAGFPDRMSADEAGLKDAAWDHLDGHRLDESKQAIYAVMMVERRGQVTVDADETLADLTGEWADRFTQRTA